MESVINELKNPYVYKTPSICKALGISRMTLYTWEKDGRITFPRNGHGDRVVTKEQLKEITKAFRPGGNHTWYFTQE